MNASKCIHCGRSVSGDTEACSSGCDLARRLPLGDEVMPASWELGGVLALGFALFNQMLFAAMDLRALALEEIALAGRFAAVSVLAGVVVLAAHGFLLWVARPKSWTDAVALVVSMGVGIGVGFLADGWLGEGIVIGLFFFNMLIGLWLARGLRFGRSSKKAQNG